MYQKLWCSWKCCVSLLQLHHPCKGGNQTADAAGSTWYCRFNKCYLKNTDGSLCLKKSGAGIWHCSYTATWDPCIPCWSAWEAEMMAQVLGALPHAWETQVELLAPGFGLALSQLLWTLEEGRSFPSLSLSQIKLIDFFFKEEEFQSNHWQCGCGLYSEERLSAVSTFKMTNEKLYTT